jgi:hypothetical protein
MIYSGAAWALIQLHGEPSEIGAASSAFERLVATARLP